jgi:hypothetical protein
MSDMTRIPEQRCWRCNYRIDATASAIGDPKPRAGGVSMCLACGAVAIFTKDQRLRKPTPSEEARLNNHPVLPHLPTRLAEGYERIPGLAHLPGCGASEGRGLKRAKTTERRQAHG